MTERTLASKTVVGLAWLMAWRMVTRLLGFVSTLALARLLAPADFGLVAMATAFSGMVDALSELGLQDALVRRVGDDRRLFDTAFTMQLIRAALTATVVAVAAPAMSAAFGEPRLAWLMLGLAAASLVAGFENVAIAEYRRGMRFDVQFRLLSLPRLLQVAVTIAVAASLRSYWALLAGIAVSKVARTVMTYAVHSYRPRLRLRGWRELAGFSFWTWANSTMAVIWERLETFVLGPAYGAATLGLYTVAMDVATLPAQEIVAPAADVLFAAFAVVQKSGKRSIRFAPMVAATLVAAIAPVVVGLSSAAAAAVAVLLGPKWADAAVPVAILAWMGLFSPFSYILNVALIANNVLHRSFAVRVVAALARLAVVLTAVALTRRLDVLAASVTGCVVIESLAYVIALRGLDTLSLRPVWRGLARVATAGGAALAVLVASGLAWRPVPASALDALAECALTGAVSLTVYVPVLLGLWRVAGCPDGPERQLLDLVRRQAGPLIARLAVARIAPRRAGPGFDHLA